MASQGEFDEALKQVLEEVKTHNKRLDSEQVKALVGKLGKFVDSSTQVISSLTIEPDNKDLKKGLNDVLTNFEIFSQLAEDTIMQVNTLNLDTASMSQEKQKVEEATTQLKKYLELTEQAEKNKSELAKKEVELQKFHDGGITEELVKNLEVQLKEAQAKLETQKSAKKVAEDAAKK